jgi:hypothetical protein
MLLICKKYAFGGFPGRAQRAEAQAARLKVQLDHLRAALAAQVAPIPVGDHGPWLNCKS